MADMGIALDWYLETSMKHQSKIVHTKYGPMFTSVELRGLGSGVLAVYSMQQLASGVKILLCLKLKLLQILNLRHYDALLPWLGKCVT